MMPKFFLHAAFAALMLASVPLVAAAQTAIKVAGLRTISLLPVQYALERGYFKREGLDVEVITVGAGPAVISAVASGSAQVGYTTAVPVLFARAQSQPVRIFNAFSYESAKPDGEWTWLVASEKSGVRTVKDLAGKVVALNALGNSCELTLREHLAKAGVPFDSVRKIVVPFPQMQAALQLDNADAACIIEPFRTNVKVSPAIKAHAIATHILANPTQRYTLDVLFVREDWGRANLELLGRFNRGLSSAFEDFRKDKALLRRLIIERFDLSPAVVSLLKSDYDYTTLPPSPAEIKPLIDGLARYGLMKTSFPPEDIILQMK